MKIVPFNSVVVQNRQRTKINTAPLNELKESILTRGLLQPPVCFPFGDGKYLLVAGERRYRAVELIHKEEKFFDCDGVTIATDEIPILLTTLETDVQRREAELDENIIRVELDWKDKAKALAEIHAIRVRENPSQTYQATGEELARRGGVDAAQSSDRLRHKVREAVLIAEHLDDPTIANARDANEAHTLILKKEEERVNAILAARRIAALPSKPDIELRHGDLLEILPLLEATTFDLIIADPPYGIGASSGGFRSRTVHHHNYEDDVATARLLAKTILIEGFRVAKNRANLFLFTDIKHWEWLQTLSAQVGWTPFRRPLIWGKSDSEGLAPWGTSGPRITTEFIFFATKGEKGLLASPTDYLRVNRVPRHERIHAAEKPVELIRRLLECSTIPGDNVLDPCCGSGSALVAARELQRRALGIEKDETFFNTAMSNVHGGPHATS